MKTLQCSLFLLGWLVAFSGCSEKPLEFTEVKRTHEKITEEEFESFMRVIDALPDKKLPEFTPVFAPPPNWSNTRTLPIKDLVSEAETGIRERWKVDWLARQLKRKRLLQRILRKEKMTNEQFVGLSLAIGVALSRNTIRDDQNLNKIIKTGTAILRRLKNNDALYHKLTQEGMHAILRDAVWIPRIDRAQRLSDVPPENIEMARVHWEKLAQIFPDYFLINPLDELVDRLEEYGIPFEDQRDSGISEITSWKKQNPIVGFDKPDQEFLPKSFSVNTVAPPASPDKTPVDMN